MFAELRRRRVAGWADDAASSRRSRCSGCCSCRPSSRCTCSSCGGTRRSVPVDPAVAPARRGRRGERAVAEAPPEPAAPPPAAARRRSSSCSPRGRSSSGRRGWRGDIVLVIDTSATHGRDRRRRRTGSRPRSGGDRCAPGPPDRRQGQRRSPPAGPRGSWRTARPTSGGSGRRSTRSSRPPTPGDLGDALALASELAAQLRRRRDPRRDRRRARHAARGLARRARCGCSRSAREREQPGDRRARGPDRAVGLSHERVRLSVANLDARDGRPPARALRRRPAPRGARRSPRPAAADRRHRSTTSTIPTTRRRSSRSGSTAKDADIRRRRRIPLAVDDRAWAIVPPTGLRTILLVERGRPVPRDRAVVPPEHGAVRRHAGRYPYGAADEAGAGRPDHLRGLPARRTLPDSPILAIAPPRTSPAGRRHRHADEPGHRRRSTPDEPILRYVDLSTTHIAEASELELPAWARAVIPGPSGVAAPLRGQPRRPCRPPSSRSSRAGPTCRSRSRSRSSSRT